MSRRHQSSRRKSYGRRQHEVRERHDRQREHAGFDLDREAWGSVSPADAATYADPRIARIQYAGE